MKTVMNVNTVMNKTKMAAIVSMLIFSMATSPGFANTKENTKDESPVEFKYIGSTNNQPVFLLNLHNSESDEFEITLRTTSGDLLYNEKISGKEIERRYRLDTDAIDAGGIKVEVISKKDNSKVVYAVNMTTRIVADVVVNKL